MPLAIGLALALSAFGSTAAATSTTPAPVSQPAAQTVQQQVAAYFADIPIMVDISRCESHFRQYDASGDVFRGEQNNQDVGVMQINEHYHLDTSKKIGDNIYTTAGNLAYARFLYEQEGTAPWSSSQPCWGKSKAAQDLARATN